MDISELYNLFETSGGIVSTDSRQAKGLFFALRGEKFDANLFAESALNNGAVYAVVDNPSVATDERYILVDDALSSLQQLALFHRRFLRKHSSIRIISITGTNGKTTTKELTRDVLLQKFNVAATSGNFNNHIGVPLTLLSFTENTQIGIVEMGANHPGEIAQLCSIAEPDFGIITNVGVAHLEGFGTEETIRKTKGELYDFLERSHGHAFFNSEDTVLSSMISMRPGLQTIPYRNMVVPSLSEVGTLDFIIPSDVNVNTLYHTNFVGEVNSLNISAAMAIGEYFGVPQDRMVSAVTKYVPSNNRSQIVKTGKGNTVILDAYNANPSSMMLALRNFEKYPSSVKAMILGQMNELGTRSENYHREVVECALSISAPENLFLVGKEFSNILPERTFESSDQLAEYISEHPLSGSTILVKGSRGNCLEKLGDVL